MTAVAMVAVMIVAAFAVVGMADNGAADEILKVKEKNILGTLTNPYVLNKNNTATASIEFNKSAFTNGADVLFNCTSTDVSHVDPTVNNTINLLVGDPCNDPNSTDKPKYSINLTQLNGTYSITFTGLQAHPANSYTKIAITVSVTDKVIIDKDNTIELPVQTYTFNSYLIVVDPDKETIKLNGQGVDEQSSQKVNFNFETDYNISSTVYVGDKESTDKYSYYAVGLPDGISMTVDGKIGGRLSSGLEANKDGNKFTVYAVSKSGHVVSQEMSYSIGVKADRGFKITEGTDTNEQYAKKTVGDTVNLVITPNPGHTLSNVEVKYDGIQTNATKSTADETYTASFKCEGTGTIKVSVSAQVDNSNVTMTKTFTVYVVGEIFNTDLDPEVTN